MKLIEIKREALGLIEELDTTNPLLTGDEDVSVKINASVNRVMFELTRIKKLPKYVEMAVTIGDVVDFTKLQNACGYEIYQIETARGVPVEFRANGTVIKILGDGVLEVDVFVYPERITDKTKDSSYEFELPAELLAIMPYGIAADLLKNDVSTGYGKVYADRYSEMKRELDPRYRLPQFEVQEGYNV
jgi:hypothetical protein